MKACESSMHSQCTARFQPLQKYIHEPLQCMRPDANETLRVGIFKTQHSSRSLCFSSSCFHDKLAHVGPKEILFPPLTDDNNFNAESREEGAYPSVRAVLS